MSILVTLCIPTHNRCEFLGRAIRSALNQTFDKAKYEIIVVDDGSTDRTDIILEAFKSDIKIIRNEKNLGLSKSLNKAILRAKGKYFLRLDSDDYINEEYINFLYTTIDQNKGYFNAVKCDYFKIDSNEIITKRDVIVKKSLLAVELFLKSMILLMSECTLQKKFLKK